MVFGFLEGCLAVLMKFHQTLIASVCQNAQTFRELTSIVLEKLKVVFASMTKGGGYDLSTLSVCNYLCFLGMTLLFSTIVPLSTSRF
jgi:predicted ATPase